VRVTGADEDWIGDGLDDIEGADDVLWAPGVGYIAGRRAAREAADRLNRALLGAGFERPGGGLHGRKGGAEMAAHRGCTVATDIPVYFCDPASPWQRGSNENTNGLLRQYFPAGFDRWPFAIKRGRFLWADGRR
jgi:hypothetical protein